LSAFNTYGGERSAVSPEPTEDDTQVIDIIIGVFKSWFPQVAAEASTEDLDDCAAEVSMILDHEGLLNLGGSPKDDDD
jgi:hypothetical protein